MPRTVLPRAATRIAGPPSMAVHHTSLSRVTVRPAPASARGLPAPVVSQAGKATCTSGFRLMKAVPEATPAPPLPSTDQAPGVGAVTSAQAHPKASGVAVSAVSTPVETNAISPLATAAPTALVANAGTRTAPTAEPSPTHRPVASAETAFTRSGRLSSGVHPSQPGRSSRSTNDVARIQSPYQ